MARILRVHAAVNCLKLIYDSIAKESKFYAHRLEQFPKPGRVAPEFDNESLDESLDESYTNTTF